MVDITHNGTHWYHGSALYQSLRATYFWGINKPIHIKCGNMLVPEHWAINSFAVACRDTGRSRRVRLAPTDQEQKFQPERCDECLVFRKVSCYDGKGRRAVVPPRAGLCSVPVECTFDAFHSLHRINVGWVNNSIEFQETDGEFNSWQSINHFVLYPSWLFLRWC